MIQTGIWWLFLGLGPVLYWLLPARLRIPALALASLALLAVFAARDLALMLALALLAFAAFRLPARVLGRLPPGLAAALRSPWPFWAVLVYFLWAKYLPALAAAFSGAGAEAVLIPLGVSYFSFKLLHYVIEERRGNFPRHGVADFLSWLFLAPIFTAGPIERFEHFLRERELQRFETRFLSEGVLRIAHGLVKKFVLGWLVLELMDRLTGGSGLAGLALAESASPAWQVWAALFLALAYVYLDFSGYSDIAIGSARLFGLRIMENFNLPFLATSLQAFWQRWHMTLAHWCRSYIYMSMIGLTRNPYAAVLATFATMGLWHSASPHWILWGLWHGAGLAWLMYWGQLARRRGITLFRTRGGAVLGWALTLSYVALGGAFTALHGKASVWAALHLIGMAFGLAG
jgi:alginate O-acetyltransferase complex protein AlgI